jgi:F-type H+-transporting ATPase subunit b
MQREQQEFLRQFRPQMADALVRAARRMLADMADADLEQQLIRTFVKQLEELDHATLTAFRKSSHKADGIRVTTSFEADADTRSRIKRAVQHHLLEGADAEIEFRHTDALLCGIEVSSGGRKLGWTLENYLQTLEQELGQAFASAQDLQVMQEPGRA